MINEVLDLIVEAEGKSQQILENANEQAGKIASDSSVKCSEIAENAVKKAKEDRAEILAESQKRADAEYKRIIEESVREAGNLVEEKSDIADKIGAEIFGRILNGNC